MVFSMTKVQWVLQSSYQRGKLKSNKSTYSWTGKFFRPWTVKVSFQPEIVKPHFTFIM